MIYKTTENRAIDGLDPFRKTRRQGTSCTDHILRGLSVRSDRYLDSMRITTNWIHF